MPIIFASPAGTGKTTHKHKLMAHFGCTHVHDDGATLRQPGQLSKGTLILCMPEDIGSHSPHIRGKLLSRAEMNAAMVAVGGKPIWGEKGEIIRA
jgi:hypothetical protein